MTARLECYIRVSSMKQFFCLSSIRERIPAFRLNKDCVLMTQHCYVPAKNSFITLLAVLCHRPSCSGNES